MDWRIKYYGIQGLSFVSSLLIVVLGVLPGIFSESLKWILWLALPLATLLGGLGWLFAQRFAPHSTKHLSPREWEELRSALEDVPVISLFHVFLADKTRMERFRYVPFLERYLWDQLSQEEVDNGCVARAAFVLHHFGVDMGDFLDGLPLLSDEILKAWIRDLASEPGVLRRREHLAEMIEDVPALVSDLAKVSSEKGDPAMEAAWRLMLFGPLAHEELRLGLDHREPKVREASLGLLEVQGGWDKRHDDLVKRIERDVHPSVQQAAMELVALEGKAALPILYQARNDAFLAGKAEELINEIEAAVSGPGRR